MAHVLGNMEQSQEEKLQPAPKSNDSPKLERAKIPCVLNG